MIFLLLFVFPKGTKKKREGSKGAKEVRRKSQEGSTEPSEVLFFLIVIH